MKRMMTSSWVVQDGVRERTGELRLPPPRMSCPPPWRAGENTGHMSNEPRGGCRAGHWWLSSGSQRGVVTTVSGVLYRPHGKIACRLEGADVAAHPVPFWLGETFHLLRVACRRQHVRIHCALQAAREDRTQPRSMHPHVVWLKAYQGDRDAVCEGGAPKDLQGASGAVAVGALGVHCSRLD